MSKCVGDDNVQGLFVINYLLNIYIFFITYFIIYYFLFLLFKFNIYNIY